MYGDWIQCLVGPVPNVRRALCDELAMLGRVRSAIEAREARLLAAIDDLDDSGAPASAVARSLTRCSTREADRKVRRADTLNQLPDAADKLASGDLTGEHVDALGRAVDETSPEQVNESGLVEQIAGRPADLAAKNTREWARRQQDDADVSARHRRQHAARRLAIFTGDDGMTVVHGEFDPVAGARLKTSVEAEANRLFHLDVGRDGASERRSGEQRRADALLGLVDAPTTADASPPAPTVRHQLILLATAAHGEIIEPRLIDGTPLPDAVFERLACGSEIFGAVFSGSGDPLWMGRRVRLASDSQFRALVARDGGCVCCGAHPSRCQAHHLTPWQPPSSGLTDIDNLALLCGHDHHLVHDYSYRLIRDDDGSWRLEPP